MALIDFIIQSKLAGYASGGEGQDITFDDGSRGFERTADGYRYLDRYHGFNPFAGSELVYGPNNALIWCMNYYGKVLAGVSEPKIIYAFLKEAMQLITPEFPFRGPAILEKRDFKYVNHQNGSLARFHGTERIYAIDEAAYVLYYHGGYLNHPI